MAWETGRVSDQNVAAARLGYEAISRGDFAVIAELLAADVAWHGGNRKAKGACHNREQVLEFMRKAHEQGGIGELVDVIDVGSEQVVVVLRPPSTAAEPPLRANLTTFDGGKVVEMVAHESPASALAAARG
jgi:ketosteroid isomerase-like protein